MKTDDHDSQSKAASDTSGQLGDELANAWWELGLAPPAHALQEDDRDDFSHAFASSGLTELSDIEARFEVWDKEVQEIPIPKRAEYWQTKLKAFDYLLREGQIAYPGHTRILGFQKQADFESWGIGDFRLKLHSRSKAASNFSVHAQQEEESNNEVVAQAKTDEEAVEGNTAATPQSEKFYEPGLWEYRSGQVEWKSTLTDLAYVLLQLPTTGSNFQHRKRWSLYEKKFILPGRAKSESLVNTMAHVYRGERLDDERRMYLDQHIDAIAEALGVSLEDDGTTGEERDEVTD